MARRSPPGYGKSRDGSSTALVNHHLRTGTKERVLVVAVGLAVTIAVLALCVARPGMLDRLINASYDAQLLLLADRRPSSLLVIVEVDDRSLRELGQWPWPRFLIARLLEKLSGLGVASVGVDFVFPDIDRTSPFRVRQELGDHFGEDLSLASVSPAARDYDRILAETLKNRPYVLGYYFEFGSTHGGDCEPKSATVAIRSGAGVELDRRYLFRASGVTCSVPVLADAGEAAGFINSRPDDDGVYRRTPLMIEYRGRLFSSLALQTVLTASGSRQALADAAAGEFTLRLDGLDVPMDAAGNLLIRFRGPARSFEYVSAADILADRVDPRQLANRIAFLGVSATGLMD